MLVCGVFHDDRAACLAFTRQQQTIQADFKLSRCRRCRGITRRHITRHRHVACLVGQGHVEVFAIFLWRVQDRAKRAINPDNTGAHLRTCGVFHGDNAACFTFTRQRQAIEADFKFSRRRRCRGVACNHWRGHRHVACLVGQGNVEGFAIFLWRGEHGAKRAIQPDDASANLHACGVFHRDDAAHFAFTGECQTIEAHCQIGRRGRCRGIARHHRCGHRHVARHIGLGDAEGFAIFLWQREDRGKRAIQPDKTATDHHTRRIFDRYR